MKKVIDMRFAKIIFVVFLISVVGYFFVGQLIAEKNVPQLGRVCETLDRSGWYLENPDGSVSEYSPKETIPAGVVIVMQLPEELKWEERVLCFHGKDMSVWVGDDFRAEYKCADGKFFGDRSAECYLMAPLYEDDGGKEVRLRFENDVIDVYDVYLGTTMGIFAKLFARFGAEVIIGVIILALGLICYFTSLFYKLIYKRYLQLEHLSAGVTLGAAWVLSNSIFRQLYTSNVSVMSDTPFFMVMLLPIPFIIFINEAQEGRYENMCFFCTWICSLNVFLCTILFVTGSVTLEQSFPFSSGCVILSVILIITTMINDFRKKLMGGYILIAMGLVLLAISAIIQIITYLCNHSGIFSGFIMSIGLFVFLLFSIAHTIKQLLRTEAEKLEAVEASEAKGKFVANMSHEIRTPLNAILGMDEIIIRESKDPKITKNAKNIQSAGRTLLGIINDILDLSKIETGKMDIIPAKYETVDVLNDVRNMMFKKASDKGLVFKMNVVSTLPRVLIGDELRIRQILLNVIGNAVKYTEEGEVVVDIYTNATSKPDMIEFVTTVSDTGIGIKDTEMTALYDSFKRLDEKRNSNIEGTGLGLNITKQLLDLMGGSIEVESKYGEGSTFTMKFEQEIKDGTPIGDFEQLVNERLEKDEAPKPKLVAPAAKILVVDDNEMNLEVIVSLLETTKIKIDVATSGQECITRVMASKYDVIFLDQRMPEMDGTETLKFMRSNNLLYGTPVIALTADAVMGAKERYLALGFDDYMSKPVVFADLERMLLKFLPKSLQKNESVPEFIADKKVVVCIGETSEELKAQKEMLGDAYKGVFVLGREKADEYLAKHDADYILMPASKK